MSEQDLICPDGIASMLKCTREHVLKRVVRRPGFPAPRIHLSQRMRQWGRDDVIAYLTAKPRSPGRPRQS